MRERRSLAVLRSPESALRIEQARVQLGGAAQHTGREGRCVSVEIPDGGTATGVVLHETDRAVDVWLRGSSVRRVLPERAITLTTGAIDDGLRACAADVRLYASLTHGQRVMFEAPGGGSTEGVLVEKCRFGAIVARDDGRVVAIGFRRLWPAARAGVS